LRHSAETTVQEITSDTGQDFFGGFKDSASRFGDVGNRKNRISDPSLFQERVLLERQFQAAHQTLVAQQRQALTLLQQFCIEVIDNQANPQTWSDHQPTLPGLMKRGATNKASIFSVHPEIEEDKPQPTTPIAWSDQSMLRPRTPAECAPEMPGAVETDDESRRVQSMSFVQQPMTNGKRSVAAQMAEMDEDTLRTAMASKKASLHHTTTVQSICEVDEPLVLKTKSVSMFEGLDEDNELLRAAKRKAKRRATLLAQELAMDNIAKDKMNGSDSTQNPLAPKAVFADAAAMKAKVKENIMRPEYNVAQFYKDEGCAQSIARSALFDNATLAVIGLNALWIWIDTDYNNSATLWDAHPLFQLGENAFCVYFAGEWLIRFMAFEVKRNGLRDAWFVFDSALVFMMVLETWLLNLAIWLFGGGSGADLGNASILRLVRLLRLTRMARMARLLRAMPELMILVKGISVAARSVIFTLLLLILILYVFAIAFRQMCTETDLEDSHFKTVPEAMITLLLQGVLPDQNALVTELGDVNYAYGAVVLLFILLSSLTIMNMLVGVLCEVVAVVSTVEKEQMQLNFVKSKLMSLIQESGITEDDNLSIGREAFEALLLMPEGARVIQEVGVDVVVLVDLMDQIFSDEKPELSFVDLMELVLQLRGSNTATVRDVVDLRKFLTQLATDSHDHVIQRVSEMVSGHPLSNQL